jgi:hypothetical protein
MLNILCNPTTEFQTTYAPLTLQGTRLVPPTRCLEALHHMVLYRCTYESAVEVSKTKYLLFFLTAAHLFWDNAAGWWVQESRCDADHHVEHRAPS